MKFRVLIRLLSLGVILSASAGVQPVLAMPPMNPPVADLPDGFRLVASNYGVALYQKDYKNGTPDFVQVVDLEEGAYIKFMHGDLEGSGEGKGVFGGTSPKMSYKPLESYWENFSQANENAFCVTNGQFFYMPENPTKLSLPLKKDGVIVSEGYAANEFAGQTLMLEVWPDRADIREMNQESLYNSTAPDILGGLQVGAPKRVNAYTGRTFVGVDDRDGNGIFETVMFFNTKTAHQADAEEMLTNFGAEKVMMLDGGGSTQLICEGEAFVYSERWIPQAIGISAAVVPPYKVIRASTISWPVLLEKEETTLQVELKNGGSETWQPGEVRLWYSLVESETGKTAVQESSLDLTSPLAYHESRRFDLPFEIPTPGTYRLSWRLARGEDEIPGEPMSASLVVLPTAYGEKRVELETLLRQWSAEGNENIPVLVENWVNRQEAVQTHPLLSSLADFSEMASDPAQLAIELKNLLAVPLMILPMGAIFYGIISRRLRIHSRS